MEREKDWISSYSLYMACKEHFGNREWLSWKKDIRDRKMEALISYQVMLEKEIRFWEFVQYKFWQQWDRLHAYANEKGIQIIGDIPIYVALDSADVWVHPEQFLLDENHEPTVVAGCRPEHFRMKGKSGVTRSMTGNGWNGKTLHGGKREYGQPHDAMM